MMTTTMKIVMQMDTCIYMYTEEYCKIALLIHSNVIYKKAYCKHQNFEIRQNVKCTVTLDGAQVRWV